MTTEERTPRSDQPDQPTDEHRDTHPGQAHVEATIENLLREERIFPAPLAFKEQANINDVSIYDRAASEEGFRAFWTEEAKRIDWIEPWTELLDWQMPYAKWFVGGKLNISANCLDRHVANGLGNKVAYYWEGEPGDTRTLTYQDLLDETCRMANALRGLGIGKGDRVAIYMPMIPELPVAMLACARIGAPHSVVFGGFSADALAGRIEDASAWRSSPPTAATARARPCRSRPTRMRPSDGPHRSGTAWSSSAPARTPGPRVGTDGGTTWWRGSRPFPIRSRWTPRTSSTCCTPPARPPSRRGSCTPPAATWSAPAPPIGTSSTSSRRTCTGAWPTSAG